MSAYLRVLIVQDSQEAGLLLVHALQRGGYNVTFEQVATCEAMEAALSRQTWDIVIADYGLPQVGGLDALRLLQDRGFDIPIILISGSAGLDAAVEAIKAGAHDFVTTDNLARLVPAVRRELHEARLRSARKQAEEDLRKSEARYRNLVEAAPDALMVIDGAGKLLLANPRAAEMVGCEGPEELVGAQFLQFIAAHDRQRASEDIRKIALNPGGIANVEYIMSRKDGSVFLAELSTSLLAEDYGEPTAFVVDVRDITDRVQAGDEIAHLKQFNRGIIQTMAEGVVVQDAEGRLAFVNPAAEGLFGRASEDLVSRHWMDLIPPDQHPIVEAADDRRKQGKSDRYVLELARNDGGRSLVLVSGSPRNDMGTGRFAGTMAVFTDITVLKQAEKALRQRNRELALLNRVGRALGAILDQDQLLLTVLNEVQHVFDVAATSLWLIDPTTGELVCRQATGPRREAVCGWRLAPGEGIAGWVVQRGESLIVPDTQADERHSKVIDQRIGLPLRSILSVPLRARQDLIGALHVADTTVNRFSRSDLTLMEPLAATAAIAIENARLFSDEELRAIELSNALEQQRELERLKDEFIQNVSHELRTPLALIQGYAELLASGQLGDLHQDQSEPVAVIARRAQMLRKLVDDLTAILATETQAPRRDPVDLGDLGHRLLADFEIIIQQSGLTLDVEVEPGLPPVSGDATRLYQVFDNLLGNALKFTPAGGNIAVRLGRRDDRVVLVVSDTGIGIPDEELGRVFERFFQVDGSMSRRYGGAGLGLAVVKEIIEAHDGSVSVESHVGRGSTFKISLPTTKREVAAD